MNGTRIHLLGLPNAQTTREYSLCGFTQATIRFARILRALGFHVTLYASEQNEAPCDELVPCITLAEQQDFLKREGVEYQYSSMALWVPIYQLFNSRATTEIQKRKTAADIICQIGGSSQQPVSIAHRDIMTLEYSIGYIGSFAEYRVFQSSAWMHWTYGRQGQDCGRFYDGVIPCFFDPEELPFCDKPEDYFLYVGRLTSKKGIGVACEIATKAGVKLKIIGHGDRSQITGGHEYLGPVDMKTRNEVMSKARALISPTLYVEPFGCAPVEAQMCGTPVITTDFGGFVETVEHGKTGYRCSYLGEFVEACKNVEKLDRRYVNARAMVNYSMAASTAAYRDYFARLRTLWNGGWYHV